MNAETNAVEIIIQQKALVVKLLYNFELALQSLAYHFPVNVSKLMLVRITLPNRLTTKVFKLIFCDIVEQNAAFDDYYQNYLIISFCYKLSASHARLYKMIFPATFW